MMNNLLNDSHFFQQELIQNKVVWAGTKLLIGWRVIFIYAALAISFTESIAQMVSFFKEGILFGIISGIGLYLTLARPRLMKGLWFLLFVKPAAKINFVNCCVSFNLI